MLSTSYFCMTFIIKFWVSICDQITKLTDFFPPNSHEGMFPPPPDDDIYDGIEEEDAADG